MFLSMCGTNVRRCSYSSCWHRTMAGTLPLSAARMKRIVAPSRSSCRGHVRRGLSCAMLSATCVMASFMRTMRRSGVGLSVSRETRSANARSVRLFHSGSWQISLGMGLSLRALDDLDRRRKESGRWADKVGCQSRAAQAQSLSSWSESEWLL